MERLISKAGIWILAGAGRDSGVGVGKSVAAAKDVAATVGLDVGARLSLRTVAAVSVGTATGVSLGRRAGERIECVAAADASVGSGVALILADAIQLTVAMGNGTTSPAVR
jgi:hypothetical protein